MTYRPPSLGMPETSIGLFPDVGGGWHLSRLPGETGTWIALTGARLKAADCLALGIATHFVESARVEALKAEVVRRLGADDGDAEALVCGAIEEQASQAGQATVTAHRRENFDGGPASGDPRPDRGT